jgi:GxxExxY protein
MDENGIAREIVDAALKIHKDLGPGLLESVYEMVLTYELERRGLSVLRQVPISVEYEGRIFEEGFRIDLLVGGKVVVELKSVEAASAVHKKQVLTYVRLAKLRLGLLINFGSATLKGGVTRIVNGLPD